MCSAAEKKMMSKAGEEIHLEPITEERASRCLARIELLNRIREDILPHPKLDERLKLCQKTLDLPDWWIAGEHDGELLIGAAKLVHPVFLPAFHLGLFNCSVILIKIFRRILTKLCDT